MKDRATATSGVIKALKDGYWERLLLVRRGGELRCRKEAKKQDSPWGVRTLLREIRYLGALPPALQAHFPRLLDTNARGGKPAKSGLPWYEMPYYGREYVTFSDLLLSREAEAADAQGAVRQISKFAFEELFPLGRENAEDISHRTLRPTFTEVLKWAQSDERLGPVARAERLRLNGREVPNLAEMIRTLDGLPTKRMEPAKVSLLHGDLFPENILVRPGTGGKDFILLDPVSVAGIWEGDFVLDLNKMESWIGGLLRALREGYYDWAIVRADRSAAEVKFELRENAPELTALRDYDLVDVLRRTIEEESGGPIIKADADWRSRWDFISAYYALCMVPNTAWPQPLARYLTACEALARFIEGA